MAHLDHEIMVHRTLDEKTLAEAKASLVAIEDEVLRAHIRRILAEEKEALFKEF